MLYPYDDDVKWLNKLYGYFTGDQVINWLPWQKFQAAKFWTREKPGSSKF